MSKFFVKLICAKIIFSLRYEIDKSEENMETFRRLGIHIRTPLPGMSFKSKFLLKNV